LICLVLCRGTAIAGAVSATLMVKEPIFDGHLRIRLFHDPSWVAVPPAAGSLFLVAADSASGKDAFFVASDLAFEIGKNLIYPVEAEQASDLLGQELGGRLRPGETQVGFVMVPPAVDLTPFLPDHPESITVRYAHHRSALAPATPEEIAAWTTLVPVEVLRSGLNAWWDWLQTSSNLPPLSAEESRQLAERLFPGEGHVLAQEDMSAEGLRNAVLRVAERRLLDARSIQRVAPVYPAAARQVGAGGLVIALCYITQDGSVGDATVLASNAPHLLNLAALSASMEWRFSVPKNDRGEPQDGWRLIPFQFRIAGSAPVAAADSASYEPPRIVKAIEPAYPLEAQRRKLKGEIIYRVTIDARGKMIQAVLEQGVDPIVDGPALAALERTRFVPATRGGKPVQADLRVPFKLTPGH
jgi:TonB family protein